MITRLVGLPAPTLNRARGCGQVYNYYNHDIFSLSGPAFPFLSLTHALTLGAGAARGSFFDSVMLLSFSCTSRAAKLPTLRVMFTTLRTASTATLPRENNAAAD